MWALKLVWISLVLLSLLQKSFEISSSSWTRSLAQYLSEGYSHCSISILQFTSSLLSSQNPNPDNKIQGMLPIFGNNLIPIGFVNSEIIWKHQAYFHRKREPCQLVIVITSGSNVSENPYKFVLNFLKILQRNDEQDGILVRDKDFFVFIAESEKIAENILMSDIRTQLRYKVASYPDPKSEAKPKVVTIFPYENPKSGKILKLNTTYKRRTNIFQDFTWNFHGFPMKMAVFKTFKPTYEVTENKNPSGFVSAKRGFFANLTEAIHSTLNISVSILLCDGGNGQFPEGTVTGLQLKNASWVGCVQDILSRNADIAIAAPTLGRFPFVHFLPRHQYDFIKFVSRKPHLEVSWTAIYKAFTPLVWFITSVSLFLNSILIWIGSQNDGKLGVGFAQIFFHLWQGLLSQNTECSSASFGKNGKILFLLWLVVSLILGTAYTSKLTSLMAIPQVEKGFPKTFKSLASSAKFRVGTTKSFLLSAGGAAFNSSEIMRNIYGKIELDEELENCMMRSIHNNFACISWSFQQEFLTGVEYADVRGVSPFFENKEMLSFTPLTQIVRKREVFRESYGYFLDTAFETGLNKKWVDMDMKKLRLEAKSMGMRRRIKIVNEVVKPLSQDNLMGSFLIEMIGLPLSFLICFVEKLYFILEQKVVNYNEQQKGRFIFVM
ncbi:unnamed protein product [Orchesella dallaii]|uniref:Uncharacterized protein n=1 Tax=Orchesella dallaii TaxID=48710 RepID=A0ABP1R522_9HEXA